MLCPDIVCVCVYILYLHAANTPCYSQKLEGNASPQHA